MLIRGPLGRIIYSQIGYRPISALIKSQRGTLLALNWRKPLGDVSLTFRELPKILSRKYTTPEITFMVRISIWKFVRVPKARLWAHLQSFSLKFSSQVIFMQYTNFEIIFWRAREMLVKQPPGAGHNSWTALIAPCEIRMVPDAVLTYKDS